MHELESKPLSWCDPAGVEHARAVVRIDDTRAYVTAHFQLKTKKDTLDPAQIDIIELRRDQNLWKPWSGMLFAAETAFALADAIGAIATGKKLELPATKSIASIAVDGEIAKQRSSSRSTRR